MKFFGRSRHFSQIVSTVLFNFGRYVALLKVGEFLADIRPGQPLDLRFALTNVTIEIDRFLSDTLFRYCELR